MFLLCREASTITLLDADGDSKVRIVLLVAVGNKERDNHKSEKKNRTIKV
jgi:hypothetical protein